jgi:uncharacterized membrane protein
MYTTTAPAVTSMILALALLPGCGRDASLPAGSSAAEPMPLTAGQLRNAIYLDILEGPVTLADGRFEGEPFMPDSASRPVVMLVPDLMANGNLTGDGADEAVVALAHNAGGSGVFMYLAIMRVDQGKPYNIATISLGDRARITALAIDEGNLVVDMVEHGPDDPMCCPTKAVRREWRFEDGAPVPLEPTREERGARLRGHLVWGHENRSFTECDSGREGWVINESGDELEEVYRELTSVPYQPMFVEIRGEWAEAPTDGFGADFGAALRIMELIRAENEGFGCRLELDGVLFVASGNEPFWRLQIREDGIFMRSMGSPDEIVFTAPKIDERGQLVTFDSAGPGAGIRVTLETSRCTDSMSGARYSWAATLDIDGERLTGCAAEGL